MKVLLINGSPRKEGNTFLALSEVVKVLEENGVKPEIVHLGNKPVRGCIGCDKCMELKHCIFDDELYNEIRMKLETANGLIVGSPVYFAGPNGSLCALLDRLFYSCQKFLAYKPAAGIAVCRRGGASAALDRLNKYFTYSNMPMVSSQYWNIVYGWQSGEAALDAEGLQVMRTLGRNMVWLLKNIKEGDQPKPERERRQVTNFIR